MIMINLTIGLSSSHVKTLPATPFSLFPLLLSLHFLSQVSVALLHLRDIHAFKKRDIFKAKSSDVSYFYLIFSMMISCPGLALIVTSLSFCLKIWQFGNEDIISSFVFLLGCQVWMETDHSSLVGLKLKRSASVPPEDSKFAGCRLHLLHLISSRSCKR